MNEKKFNKNLKRKKWHNFGIALLQLCWDKSTKHVKSWGRTLEIPPVDIRRISGTGLNDIQRIFAGYPPAGFTKFGPSDKIY